MKQYSDPVFIRLTLDNLILFINLKQYDRSIEGEGVNEYPY